MSTPPHSTPRGLSPPERHGYVANAVALWALLPLVALLGAALFDLTGIRFQWRDQISLNILLGAVFLPFALVYTFVRFDARVSSFLGSLAILLLLVPALVPYTYAVTALGKTFPLADTWLSALDRGLGFDWLAALHWFNEHPSLSAVAFQAYASLYWQAAACVLLLTLTCEFERLQIVIYAFAIGLLLCGIIALLVPAIGAYPFYGITPNDHGSIGLATGNRHVAHVLALRDGSFHEFSLSSADGIVTFPSFHATLGVVFAWALWSVPYFRWAALALNLALIAATPIHGGHYLVDVGAGILVAVVAIKLSTRLRRHVAAQATDWRGSSWQAPRPASAHGSD